MNSILKKRLKTIISYVLLAGLVLSLFTGCGEDKNSSGEASRITFGGRTGSALKKDNGSTEANDKNEELIFEESETKGKIYVIEEMDFADCAFSVYCPDNGRSARYSYNLTTTFQDKYGNDSATSNFTPGTVVELGEVLQSSGVISSVKKSDQVWDYDDVIRFDIDLDTDTLSIAGEKYKISKNTRAYSNMGEIAFRDIAVGDTIHVRGREKEIVSIEVKTGHGMLNVYNTSLFVGSVMCIGDKIVNLIRGDETIEVPEGTYDITVANDGWGGTKTYTVVRDGVTDVNLDDLRGDGPKYCQLRFAISVPDASVYLDGSKVSTEYPQNVKYGAHKLAVEVAGYDTWSKTLLVNSASATIELDFNDLSTKSTITNNSNTNTNTSADTDDEEEDAADTNSNANANSNNGQLSDEAQAQVDYLSTISGIMGNLMD